MGNSHRRPQKAGASPHARTPLRAVRALGLSLIFHASAVGLVLDDIWEPGPPAPRLAMVELAAPLEESPAGSLNPTGQDEPQRPQALREPDPEPIEEARQKVHAEEHQRQVAALEAARTALSIEVESLSADKADLAARLAAERGRAAQLERQLEETLEAERAERSRVRATYDRLMAALQTEIADKEIALHQAKEKLTVTIVDRVLFPSGQATLTPEGRRLMGKVGGILARVDDRRILIEGHTDDVPIGPALRATFPTNWELSTARATEVVKHLITEAKLPPDRLSAAGRAATAPIASNDSEDGRRQNRRIEIILLPPGDQAQGGAESS